MFISFVILALSASFYCAFAVEKQLNDGTKEEIGLLKKELENLKQRLGKVDALENEVKQLRWQLERQKTERNRRGLLIPPVWTSCPNGTVQNGNSCYMVSKEVANWANALVYCEAYGGNLAVIESASEQQFLQSHIAKTWPTSTDHYFWLGGLDALSKNEWFWSKSTTPLKYTNWRPGEPNNSGGHNSHTQDCLAMIANGLWDDGWCEDQHDFICEIKLNEDNILVG